MSQSLPEDVQCTWGVGGDPVSGCEEYANGPDGLCGRHRTAMEALASTGHTIDVLYDTETEQWGWECLQCPACHASVLTYASADAMATKHQQETQPKGARR